MTTPLNALDRIEYALHRSHQLLGAAEEFEGYELTRNAIYIDIPLLRDLIEAAEKMAFVCTDTDTPTYYTAAQRVEIKEGFIKAIRALEKP